MAGKRDAATRVADRRQVSHYFVMQPVGGRLGPFLTGSWSQP
jgi:hypothetical protein